MCVQCVCVCVCVPTRAQSYAEWSRLAVMHSEAQSSMAYTEDSTQPPAEGQHLVA